MSRSCFNCRFYTGSYYIACGVNPVTASFSPREGCNDWEKEEEAPQPSPQAEPPQAEPPQAEPVFSFLLFLFVLFVLGVSITVAVNPAAVINRHAPVVRED